MEQFIANGLCRGSIYALVALGFGLIYTTSGVFHVAHGAIYTLGAYGLVAGTVWLAYPLWGATLAAIFAAVVAGVIIEVLIYAPIRRSQGSSAILLISSFGVYIVCVNMIAMVFGNDTKVVLTGAEATFHLGNVILTRIQVFQLATGGALFAIYSLFLWKSSLGRICRAVADDAVLAEVLGVNVDRTRIFVFGLGSLFAAIGGVLAAIDVGMDPYVGLPAVLVAAIACIIGGMRRFLAPALGGMVLALIQSLIVWKASAHWESAVTFGILIIFLLCRTQGLLREAERLEEVR
jgi:branched-chain amino acid transport system permease protein